MYIIEMRICIFFFFQAEEGIRDDLVTGVQTCALPILIYSEKSGPSCGRSTINYHEKIHKRQLDSAVDFSFSGFFPVLANSYSSWRIVPRRGSQWPRHQ